MSGLLNPKGYIFGKADEPISFRVDFDELRFRKTDKGYDVWMYALSTDAFAYSDKKTKEKCELPAVIYYGLTNDPKHHSQNALIKILSELDESKAYSGFLQVNDTMELWTRALAKPALWDDMKQELGAFIEVPISKVTDDLMKPVGNRGGGGYSKAQTAYEAAQDRRKAFLELSIDPDLTDLAAVMQVPMIEVLKVIIQ